MGGLNVVDNFNINDIFSSSDKFKVVINKNNNVIFEKKPSKYTCEELPPRIFKTKSVRRKENMEYTKNYFKNLIGRDITEKELIEYFKLFDAGETNIFKYSDKLIEEDLKELADMND